jgi:putative sigma-54 modulation protein
MRIRFTARHFDIEASLQEYIEVKLEKLTHYFDRVDEAHVVLSQEGHRSVADLTVHATRLVVSSEQTADDARSAFDRAFDKVERQIRRHKGRVRDRKHGEPMSEAGEAVDGVAPEQLGIVSEPLSTTTMSPEEALQELDDQNVRFIVFTNTETGKVNVIYRRDDGNYGLVEPGE